MAQVDIAILAGALEYLGAPVTLLDSDGSVVWANNAAADALGFPSAQALIEAQTAGIWRHFEILQSQNRSSEGSEWRTIHYRDRRSGEARWSAVRATSVPGAAGAPGLSINVWHDVTPQHRDEERARFLSDASNLMSQAAGDLHRSLSGVASLCVERFAEGCAIDLLDEHGALRRAASCYADPESARKRAELFAEYPEQLDASNVIVRVLRSGQSEWVDLSEARLVNAGVAPRHRELIRALGVQRTLAVPVVASGQTIGAMVWVWRTSNPRPESEDLDLGKELGRRVGLAVEAARAYEKQRVAVERLTQLHAVANGLAEATTVEQAAQIVVTLGAQVLDAAGAALWIRDAAGALVLRASARIPAEFLASWQRIAAASDAPANEVLASGKPSWVESEHEYLVRLGSAGEAAKAAGRLHAFAALPVIINGKPEAVLSFSFSAPHRFTEDSKVLLVALAQQCAQAIDRARLHEAEGQQRANLLSMFRQAPAAIAVIRGEQHVYEMANRGYQQLIGRSERDLIGKPGREAVPELVEQGVWDIFDRVWQTGESFVTQEFPAMLDRKGNGVLDQGYFNFIIQAWNGPSGREGIFIFAFEVTQQVVARQRVEAAHLRIATIEERLRLAVESGQIGTWELNPLTQEVEFDARNRAMWGLAAEAELTLPDVLKAIDIQDRARIEASLARALDPTGTGEYEQEFRVSIPGQSLRWIASRGRATFEKGRTIRFLGTNADVTARKQSAQRLQEAIEAAKLADQRKDEFLAMLGHELRNPLAPILTSVQLLKLKSQGPLPKEHQVIERQVLHMVRLVDDLLDVSRIARGKVELKKAPIEIATLVARSLEIASPMIEGRHHHVSVAVDRSVLVNADAERMTQVIANLLTNAAKYTEPSGHIVITGRLEGGDAVVRVQDSGVGIGADLLPHVFDLFVQGKRSAARSEGGLGLGLALVKNLVLLHEGSVAVHSNGLGKGSEFVIRLPGVRLAPVIDPHQVPGKGPDQAAVARKLLVVDDNVDAAESLAALLESRGHQVQVAHDAFEALARLVESAPDVAVLDIGLPVMDGYELALKIRETLGARSPRLIALTGYGQDDDRHHAESAGFSKHLVKPVDAALLLTLIEEAEVD